MTDVWNFYYITSGWIAFLRLLPLLHAFCRQEINSDPVVVPESEACGTGATPQDNDEKGYLIVVPPVSLLPLAPEPTASSTVDPDQNEPIYEKLLQ